MSENESTPILLRYPGSKLIMVNVRGCYIESDEKMLRAELRRHHPKVALFRKTEDGGSRRISNPELIETHARRVDSIVYSMEATEDRFEPDDRGGGTLYKACAELDPSLRPVSDPDCARFLLELAGEQAGHLTDWLSCATRLDRPNVALVLYGKKGTGKSMLATAVARLYRSQWTEFGSICGKDFNAHLRSNPIVVADEGLGRGRHNAGFVRSLVSENRRQLNQKYRPVTTLLGCARLIVTTNNPDNLGLSDSTSAHDEDALAQRFLVVGVQDGAADWLESEGGREFTRHWIDTMARTPGRLVNHIWHLTQHHVVQNPGGRFLVAAGSGWTNMTTERDGPTSHVLAAIAEVVSHRIPRPEPRTDGGVAVTTAEVFNRLELVAGGPKASKMSKIVVGRQLSMLSGRPQERLTVGAARPRHWIVPAPRVAEVSLLAGVGDYDFLITLL